MSKVEEFGKRMCGECCIPYRPCIGMTDEILAISVNDDDEVGKTNLKIWLKKHHWE